MNLVDGSDLPMGFSMALARNPEAMAYFSNLPIAQQKAIIEGTHRVNSKAEMRSYVDGLIRQDFS